jgi:hypothetical protein
LKLFAAIIYERAFSPAIPIRTFGAGFKTHAVLLFSLFTDIFLKRDQKLIKISICFVYWLR